MAETDKHEDRTPENGWIDGRTADLGKRAEFQAACTEHTEAVKAFSQDWRATRDPETGIADAGKEAVLRRYVDHGMSWEAALQPIEIE